jgi:hypothetical protein
MKDPESEDLDNPFDPSRMSLGWRKSTDKPLPRHGSQDTFLRGPIPWPWWLKAASQSGQALHVASAVRYLVGRKGRSTVSFALGDLDPFLGVSRWATRHGLRSLESAALVRVYLQAGCKPNIQVCDIYCDSDPRMLYGPIPWAWWVRACRLPGRTLHVASAIWAIAGWDGGFSAVCELPLYRPADLTLGRKAVRFGIQALQLDGLIEVESRRGRPSVVTLLPVE